MLAMIFRNPITLTWSAQLWLILPLCAVVALVHKTIRTGNLRRLWRQVLVLIALMCGGLVALGVVLWLILDYWP